MIELLNLNGMNGALAEKRKNTFEEIFDALIEMENNEVESTDFINSILEDNSQQFITFLRSLLPSFIDSLND